MPRFYFNVVDGRAYLDHHGVDLPTVSAAEHEAVVTAGEIIRDGNFEGEEWAINIVDEAGKVVSTLRFSSGGESLH